MARRPSPIIQRLAIEGGDEVIAELKKMGLAGEVAGRELKKSFDAANKTGLDPFTASLKRAQQQMQTLSKSFASIGQQFTNVGRTLSIALTAPIVAGFGFAVKAAVEFESKMADIARVADFQTPQGLTEFGESLRSLSVDLGVAIGDLQDIAQAAAAGGVGAGELLGFTELIAKASVALGLSAQETGDAVAKIKTAASLGIEEVNELAGAIARLADAGAASDAQLISIVQEVGAIGRAAGLSLEEVAAIGSAMVGMGVDAESAGTAIRNMLLDLSSGDQATAGFRDALAQLGLDAVDVAQQMQTDGIGVILDLLDRLAQKAPEVQLSLLQGLFDRRGAQAIAPLLNNLKETADNVDLVADRMENAKRVNDEFILRFGTAEQKLAVFQAQLADLRIEIGNELLPVVVDLTEKVGEFVKGISDSDATFKRWAIGISAAAAALGPVALGLGFLFEGIGKILTAGSLFLGYLAKLRTAYLLAGAAGVIAAAPLTSILVGLGLLGGAYLLLVDKESKAEQAAKAHKAALDELDQAMLDVKNGVPGAVERLDELKTAHLDSAEAAVQNARAQVESLKQARQALTDMVTGPLGNGPAADFAMGATPERFSETDRALAEEIELLGLAETRLNDIQDRINGLRTNADGAAGALDNASNKANELGDAAEEAGEKIRKAFPGPAANVRSLGGNPFAPAAEGAKDAGDEAEKSGKRTEDAVDAVRGKIVTVPEAWRRAGAAAQDAGSITRAAIDDAAAGAGTLAENVRQVPVALTDAGAAATTALAPVQQAFVGIEGQATQTATALPALFTEAANAIAAAFTTAFARIQSELAAMASVVRSTLAGISAALASVRAEIAATRAAAATAAQSAGGGGGFADGGRVFGPGTSTSDSIPAWLSAGEFVVRARAVDHYGPALFGALNSLRLPRFDVPRFNAGGIVQHIDRSVSALRMAGGGAVPAMAGAGGEVRDMGRLTIGTNSGGDFEVQGPVDVLGQFARVLNRQNLTKTGRGPARLR